jgi:predicted Rossmann fold nucleotide-binding protein DprA/Smf involved in DNA uptake
MVSQKHQLKTFEGMKYRQVQRKNSQNKKLLVKDQQQWLKENGYRNIGWQNIIDLFKKIKEIQESENIASLSLEELFIEADRIGNKYLDSQEVHQHNLIIAKELNEIANIIDEQFPDNTVEVIDYTQTSKVRRKS